jgi:DNA-binding HxlR family transcriptional regulator
MLTLTLRNLERDGLLTRELFPEVPLRVEYELTDLGHSLLLPMQGLVDWVKEKWQCVKESRIEFDAHRAETPECQSWLNPTNPTTR